MKVSRPLGSIPYEWLAFRLLSALSVLCYSAYFVHLRADFPDHSPWNDWARFTDEGWYGGAALRHLQTGQWYAPGAFNPAVGLPAWPLLLRLWFAITGPGMAAARSLSLVLYGGSLMLLFRLLKPHTGPLIAVAAVLLTLLNPFCFAFYRLAILEPMVIFLLLLSLWMATPAAEAEQERRRSRSVGRASVGRAVVAGFLLCALALTKTTAIALAPAVLYQLWAAARSTAGNGRLGEPRFLSLAHRRSGRDLLLPCIAAATGIVCWLTWFVLFIRPHYLTDFHQIFVINHGHAHGRILTRVMAQALRDGLWISSIVFPLALLFVAASLRPLRTLWRVPIFGSAVLALAAYLGFIGWHTWFQPRYYLVCVMPMTIVLALGLHALRARNVAVRARYSLPYGASLVGITVAAFMMASQTAQFLLHPRYTYLSAAKSIAQTIRSDAARPQTLLSSSAEDLALFAGVVPLNPEYTVQDLALVVQQHRPGWYAASLPFEAGEVARMRQIASLHEAAHYTIFDDSRRNQLVLYCLDPAGMH